MSKKRKKSRNKKLGLILAAEVLVFVGLLVGYGWYYVNHSLDLVAKDTTSKDEIDVSDAVTPEKEQAAEKLSRLLGHA
ncbi:MAG: hypothetical protein EGQ63_04645, partial [Clostridiales bacterium]|nr:hypothetical protein [Clostridiales bacterium]